MIRVFLDANVYFSGFFSKKGASALILELARHKKLSITTSRLVLREADRNLRKKTTAKIVKGFHRFLKEVKIDVLPPIRGKLLERYEPFIHPKDVPVLAVAMESKVDYLITLDRKHFLNPKVSVCAGKMKILTPGDFIQEQLRKGKIR